jgi:hypothetical protein
VKQSNLKPVVTTSRTEVAKVLRRLRAEAKVKVDEALLIDGKPRSSEYCEAFWEGFDIARELGRNELDWIFEKTGVKNDEAKSAS